MSVYHDPVKVCTVNDIQENQMKTFDISEEIRILLVKQDGQIKAIGNRCSHYGAGLETGVLGKGRIRCPWHGACFNLETGDIEDFPGMDSLPCYNVRVDENGGVNVQIKMENLAKKRVKKMCHRDPGESCTFVIIGGGPAGAVCAETLRQEGFGGALIMITDEPYVPYDRVKISKSMDIPMGDIALRDMEFYKDHDIEVMLGTKAESLNTETQTITLSNGKTIEYGKVFIATGSRPFLPDINGINLKNVFTLRAYDDAKKILKAIKPISNVVCYGSGFIAMESAAFLSNKVKSVTIVARGKVPFENVFGVKVGQAIMDLFVEKKVKFVMGKPIESINGHKGAVKEIQIVNGDTLPCDVLIVGTGSTLNTDFLANSGIDINENGSITTNLQLQSNIKNVFVGGDIANAPVYPLGNQEATIGHYQLAQYHGRIAALNMVGRIKKMEAVPFFFTMLFGKGIRYSGHGPFNDVIIDGNLKELKFVAYYINKQDNVVAVASCARDPIVAQFAELQSQGKCITRSHVENVADPSAWTQMLLN